MLTDMDLPSMFGLAGRVVVVTGAGSGLGREMALTSASAGAHVMCLDIDTDAAQDVAALIRAEGVEADALRCDIADERSVSSAIDAVMRRHGRLDVLVNNAGISDSPAGLLHEYKTDTWRRVVDVNLHGTFHTSRAALREMVKQQRGKIINVASVWGLNATSRVLPLPAYAATKAAVVNLTRELGLQYASHGIQVNALCPGFFTSNLGGGSYENPAFVGRLEGLIPMGRVASTADLRGAFLFLASDASDYMTGQTMVVDGGFAVG